RNDANVTSVANAVRRRPARSSAARGVTATVSSHRPAANGSSADESVSSRTIASPPGAAVSPDARIENVRRYGDTVPASDTTSIPAHEPRATRRSRPTARRTNDARATSAGRPASATSHTAALLILILGGVGRGDPRHRQHDTAQPRVEPRQTLRRADEWFDD